MSSKSNRSQFKSERKLSATGKSLYRTLGLQKGADEAEIRRTYRKLALQYHPDKNPDDPEAADRFIEINYAQSVLLDPQRRKLYDRFGSKGLDFFDHNGNVGGFSERLLLTPLWAKIVGFITFLLTGCCFGCCCCCCFCCCCCCNFCCSRFAPPTPTAPNNSFDGMSEESSWTSFSTAAGLWHGRKPRMLAIESGQRDDNERIVRSQPMSAANADAKFETPLRHYQSFHTPLGPSIDNHRHRSVNDIPLEKIRRTSAGDMPQKSSTFKQQNPHHHGLRTSIGGGVPVGANSFNGSLGSSRYDEISLDFSVNTEFQNSGHMGVLRTQSSVKPGGSRSRLLNISPNSIDYYDGDGDNNDVDEDYGTPTPALLNSVLYRKNPRPTSSSAAAGRGADIPTLSSSPSNFIQPPSASSKFIIKENGQQQNPSSSTPALHRRPNHHHRSSSNESTPTGAAATVFGGRRNIILPLNGSRNGKRGCDDNDDDERENGLQTVDPLLLNENGLDTAEMLKNGNEEKRSNVPKMNVLESSFNRDSDKSEQKVLIHKRFPKSRFSPQNPSLSLDKTGVENREGNDQLLILPTAGRLLATDPHFSSVLSPKKNANEGNDPKYVTELNGEKDPQNDEYSNLRF